MLERKILSSAELNAWLTSEIRKIDGCHECKLTWKYRLRDPGQHDGCNWSDLNLQLGEGADLDTAVKAAGEIERRAFKLFNLEDEAPASPQASTMEFHKYVRPRLLSTPVFQLDANLINAKQKLEAVNQLETWRDNGVICLVMSGIAHTEAQAGGGTGAEARRKKAASHIFTINEAGEAEEDDAYSKVEAILWGKATNDNQANDVEVVCEAIKWHAILITNDGGSNSQPGGILGNSKRLSEELGLQVLRPEEAVEFIRNKILERDGFNAQVTALTGKPVPEWTGQD
ncbi:hypothetical protein SAMN05518845_11669 [Variovorax sp. YR750]|uniref:hypothetical protein n=1 Tax=Variovorax sp. YR750 TaxID=1884384 RepID=UPI0008C273C7|nr:hypothetical protein [Variovorax sp. YR750]SEM10093.1 hypothetical protein SAMN05518845_11669 [Variovorax sp. YR750]